MTARLVTCTDLANGPELLPGVDASMFANACRSAGLAFLAGAESGWGKLELAEWLLGPYAAVSTRLGESDGNALSVAGTMAASMGSGIVRATAVEELIELVRVAVSSTLVELHRDETLAITQAIRERHVAWARASEGLVWTPVDHPRMRLEARVTSLFAVDYLLRPRAYELDLAVCTSCDHVSFDGADRSCDRCNERGRTSHIRGTENAPGLIVSPTKKSAG